MLKKKDRITVEVPKGKRKRHHGVVPVSSKTIKELSIDRKLLIDKRREDRRLGKIE